MATAQQVYDDAYRRRMGLAPRNPTATDYYGGVGAETPGYRSAATGVPPIPPAPPTVFGGAPAQAPGTQPGQGFGTGGTPTGGLASRVYAPITGTPAPRLIPPGYGNPGAPVPNIQTGVPIPPQRPAGLGAAPYVPSGGYGGGSPVPTGPGLPPSQFSSPYGSGPSGPASPPIPPGIAAGGGYGGGSPAPTGSGLPPSTFSSGYGTPGAPASPSVINQPTKQTIPAALPPGTQVVPLPPPRPTAALAPQQNVPLPPSRPAGLGVASPAAVPQPPVTHVNGPAWLGAFFRAGQPSPTGMSAMVNQPISDLGSGR